MSPASAHSGAAFVRPRINLGHDNHYWPEGVNSLLGLIEFAAEHNPDHIFGLQAFADHAKCGAVWEPPGKNLSFREITFAQFHKVVERASAWLVHSGATSGRTRRIDNPTPVAIFLSSDITIFMYMAALLRIGTPVLILSNRLPATSVAHLLRETKTSTVLSSIQFSRTAGKVRVLLPGDARIHFINAPTFFDLDQQQGKLAQIPPIYSDFEYNDLDAIILHTSGTTGLPKPIYHAQAYVLLYATCHRLPPQRESFQFNVSTLPLYHGFGLLAPCLSLSIGMPFVLLPPSTIPTAQSTVAAQRATGARYMLTVPSIVEDILQALGTDGLATLRELEILAIGGAPIKDSVVQDLVQAGVNLLNHWGTTETGPIAPIERPIRGYNGGYIMPRTDLNLKFLPIGDDGKNTLRLIGKAPGWEEPYIVQDLLEAHPRDKRQFRILGRADDLLVLATGEKILPAAMEREISRHPSVKGAIVFGDGKSELGVIIELMKGIIPLHVNLETQQDALAIISQLRLETYIQRGNEYVEGHGKITKEMVVLTREDVKPLKRTEKGSLARKENYVLFEREIKTHYEKLEVVAMSMPLEEMGMGLRRLIRRLVQDVGVVLPGRTSDGVDFFEAGMDSLQAMRLQRAILSRFRAKMHVTVDFSSDFIFVNPSVDKLSLVLSPILVGSHTPRPMIELVASREERRIATMEAMVMKHKRLLAGFSDMASHTGARPKHSYISESKSTVLLTGSTGNLGCFLLARLVRDPNVNRVICLNRPSTNSLRARQVEQMRKHGIILTKQEWDKLLCYECDLSGENLSLGPAEDQELLNVTHVIHNAWPVNLSWTLSSFSPQIKSLVNLMQIAWKSSAFRGGEKPTRLLFASSIAVVAKYPLLSPNSAPKVPERAFGPAYTAEMGYAEAKWVCEELVKSATSMHSDKIQGCSVRIGQLSGSEGSGVWNEYEHFPVLVRMSRVLETLPLLEGSFSWKPLNIAACSIVELLYSQRFRPIYHVENPIRQSWKELMQTMVTILQKSQRRKIKLISYLEWCAQLRELGNDPLKNLAYPLLSFFEKDFLQLSTGGVVLDTTIATEESTAMATSRPVKRKLLLQYVTYWESIGVL